MTTTEATTQLTPEQIKEFRERAARNAQAVVDNLNKLVAKDEGANVADLVRAAKQIAGAYYRATGRPLGCTAEIAEHEAARLLGLTLADVREPGYDAVDCNGRKLQIKARCLMKGTGGQRIGRLDLNKPWDAALLVLLDAELEVVAIHEAARDALTAALIAPGSKSRNERGALSVSKFKQVGRQVWSAQEQGAAEFTIDDTTTPGA
jgi:hypothetical protein